MAQVIRVLAPQQRIDSYLDYSFREWRSVPELVEEWAEWEDHDRYDFWVEWPIRESYLDELRRMSGQGLFTPDQQACYEELLRLVDRHRPTLEALCQE